VQFSNENLLDSALIRPNQVSNLANRCFRMEVTSRYTLYIYRLFNVACFKHTVSTVIIRLRVGVFSVRRLRLNLVVDWASDLLDIIRIFFAYVIQLHNRN
jgi:hypothetical protein